MTRDFILSLLQTLFPGARFYVMLASDGEWNGIIANCWGETGRTFDVVNRELLEARGMWQGRGRAIFVNDVAIRKFAEENAEAAGLSADELFRQLVASVVTHEAGHIAEQGFCFAEPSPILAKYASLVSAYSVDYNGSDLFPPFRGHSCEFVRLTLHAAYRTKLAGFGFPLRYLWTGSSYAIGEPDDFDSGMGSEPQNLIREPLTSIPSFTAPTNLRRQWNSYVRCWIQQQLPDSPAVADAISMMQDERLLHEIATQ